MAVNTDRAGNKPLIETRSIDYIPEAERHGRLFSQFTLWMGANLANHRNRHRGAWPWCWVVMCSGR
jgi:purine-cytosine permease-like protein